MNKLTLILTLALGVGLASCKKAEESKFEKNDYAFQLKNFENTKWGLVKSSIVEPNNGSYITRSINADLTVGINFKDAKFGESLIGYGEGVFGYGDNTKQGSWGLAIGYQFNLGEKGTLYLSYEFPKNAAIADYNYISSNFSPIELTQTKEGTFFQTNNVFPDKVRVICLFKKIE